jgi:thiamine pyridinylase
MPALYLDAWADSRSTSLLLSALRVPVDTDVVAGLRDLFAQGAVGDTNPCLDGTYDDNNLAPEIFGTGNADALLGYSERLHYAVQTKAQPGKLDPSSILIASAPLGEGTDPIWFIDAFVTPRSFDKSVPEEQQSARRAGAKRFISYMNDAQTFAWIHQSKDLGADAAPRYLLPATRSAFGVPAIAQDPIMQQIRPLLDQGTFFPQHQIPGIRRVMRDQVLSGVR